MLYYSSISYVNRHKIFITDIPSNQKNFSPNVWNCLYRDVEQCGQTVQLICYTKCPEAKSSKGSSCLLSAI